MHVMCMYVIRLASWSYIIMYMSSKCMYMYCLHMCIYIFVVVDLKSYSLVYVHLI